MTTRLATRNFGSLSMRLPRVPTWLGHSAVDVLVMHGTKLADGMVAAAEIAGPDRPSERIGRKTATRAGIAGILLAWITDPRSMRDASLAFLGALASFAFVSRGFGGMPAMTPSEPMALAQIDAASFRPMTDVNRV
jgi:hypothetical protein